MTNQEILLLIRFHNAQTKGPIIEKIITHILEGEQIKASENCGDIRTLDGKTYEIKSSFENKANTINIRQIRLWQNIDFYIIPSIDSASNYNMVFKLSHDEMTEEVQKHGSASHGTSQSNQDNINIEQSITIKRDTNNEIFKRWDSKYRDYFIESELFS